MRRKNLIHIEGKRGKNKLKITLEEVRKKDLISLYLIKNITLHREE